MNVVGLFVESADLALDDFGLKLVQLNLRVDAINLILQLGHSVLELFHLVLDFVDDVVKGLLFGFVLSLGLLELRHEVLLIL